MATKVDTDRIWKFARANENDPLRTELVAKIKKLAIKQS
jgi:hypothetical protein